MITVLVKRKFLINKIDITKLERFVPFDINLPSNVIKIKSVLITASKK